MISAGDLAQDAEQREWERMSDDERAAVEADEAAEDAYYAALMAEAEHAQAAHIAAEEARLAGLVQVGPYTYADPQCEFCRGTGVVTDSVPYGMGNVSMDSPCECVVDYEWAVTEGDGIAINMSGRTHEGDHLGKMYFYNKRELGGGVIVQQRTFSTAAALLDACAIIAPLAAWQAVQP